MEILNRPDLLVAALVGGVIPDLLRFARVRFDAATLVPNMRIYLFGLLCQLAIASIAAFFAAPTTVIAAASAGFAGPEIVTRLLSGREPAIVESAGRSSPSSPGLLAWWRI